MIAHDFGHSVSDKAGDEFLLLGTEKAKSLVKHTKSLKTKSRIRDQISKIHKEEKSNAAAGLFGEVPEEDGSGEKAAPVSGSSGMFIRRRWIPKQISK